VGAARPGPTGRRRACARAAAAGGDFDAAERFASEAREVLASIDDAEDREVVEKDLVSLPRRP
jgi:hypothetical protein